MKSITKRRLKPRSIGRNTLNRRHKRRHSNRRWNAKQDKSRKKRMIGGSVGYKGGRGLTGMFKRSGWECECVIPPPPPTDTDTGEPPMGKSARPRLIVSKSIVDATAPVSQPPQHRRRVRETTQNSSTDVIDGTRSRKYLADGDYKLTSVKDSDGNGILINANRGYNALPKSLENNHLITKINNMNIRVNTLAEFYQLLDDNGFYDKPVVLTVSGKHLGGTDDKTINVSVNLRRVGQLHKGGGGKKTTYRRKKHVTRRKINTKRRKVMVGGIYLLRKLVNCNCKKEMKGTKPSEKGESEAGESEAVVSEAGDSKGTDV